MPSMANITVKNTANGDVTYSAATASAGDSSPAVWRNNSASAALAYRPTFTLLTRDNTRRNGRVFRATFKWPVFTQDVNNNDILLATVPFELNGTLPTNIDSGILTEAFTQLGNLLVSALVRAVVTEGYAPT